MTSHSPPVPEPAAAHLVPAMAVRVGHLVARCHFMARDLADEVLRPFEIDVKQFAAILILDSEGPLSQQALGARIGCDRTTMVDLVDGLEDQGLIARRRNPADRRAYALELTAAGHKTLARTDARLGEAEAALLSPLAGDERDQLRELLRRVLVREPSELVADAPVEGRAR